MKAYWDDDIAILSAENIEFQVETAGLSSRFAAVMIDMTLQFIAFMLVLVLALWVSYSLPAGEVAQYFEAFGSGLLIITIFFIFYAYFFIFEWLWAGQTPGKRWLGLRVLHADGMPVTWWPVFVRNLLRIIDFMPFFYGAGSLIAVLNTHNQRIGDQVAGTVVARERRGGEKKPVLQISEAIEAFLHPGEESPRRETPVDTPIAPSIDVQRIDNDPAGAAVRARLDQEDYELVRDYLARREQLPEAARKRLVESLAMRLAIKLNRPAPAEFEREALLEEVARAFGKKS